jgi:hypothetical protein
LRRFTQLAVRWHAHKGSVIGIYTKFGCPPVLSTIELWRRP